MYLHRYLRYTPSLALIILFYVCFTKFLGSGPFFDTYTGNCEKYWWSALLHLTVYTNPLYPVGFFLIFHWKVPGKSFSEVGSSQVIEILIP